MPSNDAQWLRTDVTVKLHVTAKKITVRSAHRAHPGAKTSSTSRARALQGSQIIHMSARKTVHFVQWGLRQLSTCPIPIKVGLSTVVAESQSSCHSASSSSSHVAELSVLAKADPLAPRGRPSTSHAHRQSLWRTASVSLQQANWFPPTASRRRRRSSLRIELMPKKQSSK